MHAHSTVAYAYDAAMHCPHCARAAYASGALREEPGEVHLGEDQNGLPYTLTDREGNTISALFSCAVEQKETCDDCLSVIPGTEQD